eukprot:g46361.t1
MLYKMVSEAALGHTAAEEATSGAVDAVDQVDRCAGEPLSNVESLFCALNGGEGRGVGAVSWDRSHQALGTYLPQFQDTQHYLLLDIDITQNIKVPLPKLTIIYVLFLGEYRCE